MPFLSQHYIHDGRRPRSALHLEFPLCKTQHEFKIYLLSCRQHRRRDMGQLIRPTTLNIGTQFIIYFVSVGGVDQGTNLPLSGWVFCDRPTKPVRSCMEAGLGLLLMPHKHWQRLRPR